MSVLLISPFFMQFEIKTGEELSNGWSVPVEVLMNSLQNDARFVECTGRL